MPSAAYVCYVEPSSARSLLTLRCPSCRHGGWRLTYLPRSVCRSRLLIYPTCGQLQIRSCGLLLRRILLLVSGVVKHFSETTASLPQRLQRRCKSSSTYILQSQQNHCSIMRQPTSPSLVGELHISGAGLRQCGLGQVGHTLSPHLVPSSKVACSQYLLQSVCVCAYKPSMLPSVNIAIYPTHLLHRGLRGCGPASQYFTWRLAVDHSANT